MIYIKIFGVLKDAVGHTQIELRADGLTDIEALERHLFSTYPEMERYRDFMIFLMDHTIVRSDRELKDGDAVTVMIPTSGG